MPQTKLNEVEQRPTDLRARSERQLPELQTGPAHDRDATDVAQDRLAAIPIVERCTDCA